MKKIMMACGFVACLPLAATANNVDIEKELNGLDIEAEISGSAGGDAGPAPGGTGGVQAMLVTNNGDVSAVCQIEPHPSETSMTGSPRVSIEPGESATMRLEGSYTSATTRARLVCEEAS